jgi:hypothetical protein
MAAYPITSIMAFVLFAGLGDDLGLTITGPLFDLR